MQTTDIMTKHITVLDLFGDISYLSIPNEETKYKGQNVFRKVLRPEQYSSKVEIEIAKCIMQNPCHNVVEIYDVVENGREWYIDMEELDVHCFGWEHCILDVINALTQMHALNIVYIDIKEDNVGFSRKDGVFKLFDFNCSGILNKDAKNTWLFQPYQEGFTYKSVMEYEKYLPSLGQLDDMIIKKIADKLLKSREQRCM
jgi:serine/threonine protein kinase